ncbi:MAG: acyl-CoA dehydrogenase family protein [Pseudomonadales bacterium]|nr:acyl-CoA dehydrogenase family protein [Pseudomonadales bacterium]
MTENANLNQNRTIPSEAALIERARAFVPMLKSKAEDVEKNRAVPHSTIDEFKKAGFFKIVQPAHFGGWEMNPTVFYKVLMELGRGCCSSAWNMMILGVHQWEFGLFPKQAGDDVWGKDNTVAVSSSYAPWGKATKVDGGYVLNGTWRTSSGCDHADWAIIGARIENSDGKIDAHSFLVEGKDYQVDDDWHTFGLCGTGSRSLVVKDAFVPDYRHHSIVNYELSDRGDMYLFPFNMIFYFAGASVMVGYGQGATELFTEEMQSRQSVMSGNVLKHSPHVKGRLANAVVKVRSARARLLADMQEATEYVNRRELVPSHLRMLYLMDGAHCGKDVEEAALLLYKATSARGIFLSSPLQRVVRDILAAANHPTLNVDDNANLLGGYLLNGELPAGFN